MSLELQTVSLYDRDFAAWLAATVEQLRAQDYSNVDWVNLIEEIEDMSKRERKALKSNLVVILLHLLKWQYQPEARSGSWKASIREHRRRIADDLQDSPSLKPFLETVFADCYVAALAQASDETGLLQSQLPPHCPYSISQTLSSEFLPA